MSNDAFDPSLLVFAALAAFVLWKLYSVLGMRSERDAPAPRAPLTRRPFPPPPLGAEAEAPKPAEDAERWTGLAEKGSKGWAGLDAIAAADPKFSGPRFIEGARKAYETIAAAFAKGDRDTLRRLLAPEVFDNFAKEISGREARGETAESAVVSIDSSTVEDARCVQGKSAVTVRFAVKLLSVRRDRDGAILEGGLDRPNALVEVWTFSRAPASPDPNWKLVATEHAH